MGGQHSTMEESSAGVLPRIFAQLGLDPPGCDGRCDIATEQACELEPAQFEERYVETNTPVIINGLTDGWEAHRLWDLEYFSTADEVANEPVCVFLTKTYDGEVMECTMGEYVRSFDQLKERAAGRKLGDVPYLRSWEVAQVKPEMLTSCAEGFAYFKDMFSILPAGNMVKPPFTWLFIGPTGSYTGVHADAVSSKLFSGGVLTVDAWTTVIRGRKLFRLWPAHALENLYVGKMTGRYGSREFVDMSDPDLGRFPECQKVKPVEVIVEAGQVIYIPKNWAHDVLALEDTISLTTHWLTKPNLRQVLSQARAAAAAKHEEKESMMDRIRALKAAKLAEKAEKAALAAALLRQPSSARVNEFHLSSPSRAERPSVQHDTGSVLLSVHAKQGEFQVSCAECHTVAQLKQKIVIAAAAQQVGLGQWLPDSEAWIVRHETTALSDTSRTLSEYGVKHNGAIYLECNLACPTRVPTQSARFH